MTRLLIVEDDPFTRVLIRQVLKNCADIEIIGEAHHGQMALEMVDTLKPDIISMDIMMPGMDGLETTRQILAKHTLPIIMVSELTHADSLHTVRALELGAADYLSKSSDYLPLDIPNLSKNLPEKVRYWAKHYRRGGDSLVKKTGYQLQRVPEPQRVEVVVIGASAGGTQVLPEVINAMGTPSWPMVITQQMPAIFSQAIADQLIKNTGVDVILITNQLTLKTGNIYLAPGGTDTVLTRDSRGQLTAKVGILPGTEIHPCASSLFESVVNMAMGVVGVILSGVGNNGCRGANALIAKGWPVLVQKPETCLVDEMPLAALYAGAASAVMTPLEIGQQLARWR